MGTLLNWRHRIQFMLQAPTNGLRAYWRQYPEVWPRSCKYTLCHPDWRSGWRWGMFFLRARVWVKIIIKLLFATLSPWIFISDPYLIIDTILDSALISVTIFHVLILHKYFWINPPGFAELFRAVMMFFKGIKSKWKTDKVLKYKRCYIQVVKGKRYRKDFLGMQAITGVSYQDAPVESDTTINFLNQPITGRFDSFLFMIRVENYALICMSNNGRHFSNFRTIEHCKVNGVGGFLSVKGVEIIFWWIEDDKGVSNTIKIKCALYVPSLPIFFLCAQHWIQQANDHFPSKRGTWCA